MKCRFSWAIFLSIFLIRVEGLPTIQNLRNNSLRKDNQIVVEDRPHDATASEVSTLVELPLDYHTSISYYFPYFVKAKLISFHDEIDPSSVSTHCVDPRCQYCDPILVDKCLKCETGSYLSNSNSCEQYCSEGYIADTLRGKCIAPEKVSTEIISTMSYSKGSCQNMCGHYVDDCSCSNSCIQRGNCCSDYKTFECEEYFLIASRKKTVECENSQGCEACSNIKLLDGTFKCNQCQKNYFLYEGKCYSACPQNTSVDKTNNICVVTNDCTVENCSKCGINNNECKSCKRGTYLHEGSCLNQCPSNLRADRITWSCLEPPVFAWYWVYPSRTTCKAHCGIIMSEDWDCSCSPECFRVGNCCQDIENYCEDLLFWRKHSK